MAPAPAGEGPTPWPASAFRASSRTATRCLLLDFPERLRRIVRLPLWAFHGERDAETPVAESMRMVEALRGYGGDAKLTVYPDTGHDAWTRTCDDPELYGWFLRQVRLR